MLTLRDIKKEYRVGDMTIPALKGVSIQFRKSEFVSVLGQSGCGKTTLLNIIGGLDQYTEGDLIINGVSTKKFKDSDWDSYRNHSIGFVFQSYNLIPHQTVLSNVELALTLSGVSKSERRKRAVEALEKVGLGDQLNKKPNQMSGGQMQRVAIARALVNNPDILLADEPTGALDSETSVQIMEILKEVAKDKLVIMVTHNPDLAEEYSTRIVRLLDGKLISDSDPYEEEVKPVERTKKERKAKKTSMSFFTALSLSFNNLLTKKGRTFMTAFAGSIGIIGIALILSVSTGVQEYIDSVQRDTLSSYPITIQGETVDSSALFAAMMGVTEEGEELNPHDMDKVYANATMYDMMNSLNNMETRSNNLRAFKKYLDENEEMKKYVSSILYSYDMDLSIYTKDVNGKVIKSDVMELMRRLMGNYGFSSTMMETMGSANMNVWSEMLAGDNGELVHNTVKEQYDLVYGDWPKAHNEVVILVNRRNEISDMVLYALGLTNMETMIESMQNMMAGETVEQELGPWTYEELCGMEFRVIPSAAKYQKQEDGTYTDLSASEMGLSVLYDNAGFDLKVVGILRPNENAVSTSLDGAIAYTTALTDFVMKQNSESEIIKAQQADPTKDIITGLPFETGAEKELTAEEKVAAVKTYFGTLDNTKKTELYGKIMSTPSDAVLMQEVGKAMAGMGDEDLLNVVIQAMVTGMNLTPEQAQGYVANMSAEEIKGYATQALGAGIAAEYAKKVQESLSVLTMEQIAGMFDMAMTQFTDTEYVAFYEEYVPKAYSESTYDDNLKLLGYADPANPSAINIYAESFEDKDKIAEMIEKYNKSVKEEDVIEYTDIVALLMSSITTVINAISYVLIAFVAISLVVSSIMIGIITYISVLERTKEIGILRAIGASKRDISRVFNAETIIVGFVSGAIGILVTLGFILIINVILHSVTGIQNLSAVLPPMAAVILVGISMLLTFLAGLFPSKVAAKKDPVIALRSE